VEGIGCCRTILGLRQKSGEFVGGLLGEVFEKTEKRENAWIEGVFPRSRMEWGKSGQ